VIKWLKKEGDRVQGGDILAEIETDKADVEMEAFGAGVLRKILVGAGDRAPVGSLIAVIAEPNDDIASLISGAAPPASAAGKPAGQASAPGATSDRPTSGRHQPRVRGPSTHAEPRHDRQAHAAQQGPGTALLRDVGSRDGPRVGAAGGAERARRRAQDLGERSRHPRLRAGAAAASGGERLVPGRLGSRLAPRPHRYRRRAGGGPHHAGAARL